MLHGARSMAVPTYHIRPTGETASFHEGKQRATRPSVSGVSSSAGTAGWRSLAAQARPVKAYHTTIHPIGACCRCKKATIVAELTHPCRRRHRGNRPSLDQVCIGFPGGALSLAMELRQAATGRPMTAPLHHFPIDCGRARQFVLFRETVRPAYLDCKQQAWGGDCLQQHGQGAIRVSVRRFPRPGLPIRNRLTARPVRLISRHPPSTRALSAPVPPEPVALAFPDGDGAPVRIPSPPTTSLRSRTNSRGPRLPSTSTASAVTSPVKSPLPPPAQ